MIAIRPFDSYRDALSAVAEAGFRYVTDSNVGRETGGRSFAPTETLRHPETGETVRVFWNSDRGAIDRG